MLASLDIIELVEKAQKGDEKSKELLVESNAPLIKSVIKRFLNKGIEFDDLYQIGCLGLLKAIKNFDPSFDVKFSTYAVPMVIGEIKRFMRDDGAIKVSRSLKSLNISINKFVDGFVCEHKEKPTVLQIAAHFNVDQQEIIMAMESARMPISLYIPVDDDESVLILDKVDSENCDNSLFDKLAIKDAIRNLCERDKKIILMRYFYDKTQNEISKKLGISQVQVSRLENKILKSIKENFVQSESAKQ